jgi:hypothetical protein
LSSSLQARGTSFDLRIFLSRVSNGTPWTALVDAIGRAGAAQNGSSSGTINVMIASVTSVSTVPTRR